ncbi:MAG: P-loop NTPase [Oscillospiraceae bacterium]|nr:P-loop NTPase [Oscillospiraceae bacterium]
MGEAIAVLSGKGGTGKTSVCAGVATALAATGMKVLCIDCDIGLRNLDISLGLSQLSTLSFTDVCQGGYSLDQAAVHPDYPNLQFLTAPMNCPANKIDQQAFGAMLRQARALYHYIFLDAPAGIDTGFELAAKFADRVLLITGPDPAAIRDASRAGELLELMGKLDVRMVVNRVNKKMVSAMELTIDDVMDQAGLPLIGVVPEDPQVILAATFGTPLQKYAKRGASAACRRIATRIQGLSVPVSL